jgi:hypothetical protein
MIEAGRYYIRPNRISPINLNQADIENFSQQLLIEICDAYDTHHMNIA